MQKFGKGVHEGFYKPIQAGAATDIQNLFHAYKQLNTCSFEPFASLYSQKEFTSIYLGHCYPEELVEFSERLLQIAMSYIYPPHYQEAPKPYVVNGVEELQPKRENSFEAQIFGIYLTYSLFNFQPNKHVCLIRVTPNQFRFLKEAVSVFVDNEYLDASFCLFRLFDANAFQIYAFEKEYEMLSRSTHVYKDDVQISKAPMKTLTHLTSLMNDSCIMQLQKIHTEYTRMKDNLQLTGSMLVGPSGPMEELQRIEKQARANCDEVDRPPKTAYQSRKATRERAQKGVKRDASEQPETSRKRRQTMKDDPVIQHLYDNEGSLRNTNKILDSILTQEAANLKPNANEAGTTRAKTTPVKVKATKKDKGKAASDAKDVLLSPRKRLFSGVHDDLMEGMESFNDEAELMEAETDQLLASLKG
ncbi:hypothetical protein L596_018443 [Steinernema carpocapsae]|uniref:Uncharacterized protein n=1 Tax=Steinernema carpocapsae TaxID=34508 RepID=A0A4U5N5G3_STECR|nr:hypothetical protein L596_018443 [Steinernema carpocapsae]